MNGGFDGDMTKRARQTETVWPDCGHNATPACGKCYDALKADLGAITELTLDEDPVQGVRNLTTLRAGQDRALQAATEKVDALAAEVDRLRHDDHVVEIERLKRDNAYLAGQYYSMKELLQDYLAKGWTKGWEQRAREASK